MLGKVLIRVVLWTALFLSMVLVGSYGWLMQYATSSPPPNGESEVVVVIPKGTSVREIGEILGDAGILHNDIRFELLARWRGVAAKLRAGEFALPTGRTPQQLLDALLVAKPYQYAVTIPEGLRAEEIAEIFAENGWCDPYLFMELVEDEELIDQLGLSGISSLEGYLFPDTYFLSRSSRGAEKIITMLVNRFLQVWSEVAADSNPTLDRHQTVIMASIVEKETGDGRERPLIAAVFLNRLRKGMKLQSDPTVIYGSGRFDQPITKSDLADDNPYNTYFIAGMPVGPIASPGKAALQAVLNPDSTEYLYFVSKNDGTHHFSTTLREHINAVNKFQRKNATKSSKE